MNVGDKINSFEFIRLDKHRIDNISGKRKMGVFKCSCGLVKSYDYSSIKLGKVKTCLKCSIKIRAKKKETHGLIKHPLYRKWQDMKNRCYNKNVDRYNNYGALGIEVCNDWRYNFKKFYDWSISNGWEKGLTIERNEINGNYEPSNCRYISMIDQGFNKKNTFYIESNGIKMSLAKLMYVNGKSEKYRNAWFLIRKSNKSAEFVISKYNLDVSLIN